MNSFKTIPLSRALIYLVAVGSVPLACLLLVLAARNNHLEEIGSAVEHVRHQALIKEKKQSSNLAVRQHFREADHFYIDKHLETLVFLEAEIEHLQKMVQDKHFNDDERIKKRLEFLTGSANALSFSEGVVHAYPFFQETTETLAHPVEVNLTDIIKILARIEGLKIGDALPGPHRPQLIVTEFKLDKKRVNDKNEHYLLDLKLIKREFL